MKALFTILTAAAGAFCATSVASAQGAPPPPTTPYNDSYCGSWQGDTWTPNGNCPSIAYKHEVVTGTIVSVKGHLVTVQQANKQSVIDDTAALSNQSSGRVAVGRQIVAHGYWEGENFYATAITSGQPPPP